MSNTIMILEKSRSMKNSIFSEFNALIMRSIVDLPKPFGPVIMVTPPDFIDKLADYARADMSAAFVSLEELILLEGFME